MSTAIFKTKNKAIDNILCACGLGAQDGPYTATISDLLRVSIGFLIIPYSSTRCLPQLPAETYSSEAGETW
jgi:hypothetical protein